MDELINYNDLIFLVIDGEASDVERAILFKQMSENIELQNEFQVAIKMQKASENIGNDLIPPSSLANNIFQKSGLNYIPNSENLINLENSTPKYTSKKHFVFRPKSTLTSIFLGMLVGAFIMYMLFYNKLANNDNQIYMKKDDLSIKDKYQLPNIIMHYPNSDNINAKNHLFKNGIVSDVKFSKQESIIDVNYNKLSKNDDTGLSMGKVEVNTLRIDKVYESKVIDQSLNQTIEYTSFSKNDDRNYGLSLEVKNSAYWNFNKENVLPSEISKFHNMDLFVFKSLGSGFNVGLGVKQETFYAQYKSVDELGREFIFEQQPNLTNFESAIRYFPLEENLINPFIQLNLGMGEYGYSYRLITGSTINFLDNFSSVINIDFAGFIFAHKNNTYDAKKIGFNYGIIYKF